jgi:integrase/recombinase XerD
MTGETNLTTQKPGLPGDLKQYASYISLFELWARKNKIDLSKIDMPTLAHFLEEHPMWAATIGQDEGMISDVHKFLKIQSAAVSPSTIGIYTHYLTLFAIWMRKMGIDPDQADQLTVIDFLQAYPKWSFSTRHNAAAAIRQFYRWKYGEGHPVTLVHVRKVEPPPQRTLSAEELSDLLNSIETSTSTGKRDKAIVCLMADTGMRASEICNLEIKNLDLTRRSLVTLTKGARWMPKVFTHYTANTIQEWLDARPKVTKDAKFVFVSMGGKRTGTQLTRHGLHSLFERLAARASMGYFSPHAMRRTFATLAIENGAPTRLVQVAGGWSTVAMVERYTRALKPDAIAGFSPITSYSKEK